MARDYKGINTYGINGAMLPVEVKRVGNVHPSGKGMSGEVYSSEGVSGTLTTNKGQGQNIAIPVLTPDRAEKRQNGRRFKEDGDPSFTLTAQDRHGVAIEPIGSVYAFNSQEFGSPIMEGVSKTLKAEKNDTSVVFEVKDAEPIGILRDVRSDYGKDIRKDYDSGKIDISRHEFLEKDIREDGITNTISTVTKDNMLAVNMSGYNVSENDGVAHCLNANDQRKFFGAHQARTMATVQVKEATAQGYAECRIGGVDSVNLAFPSSETRRGRVQQDMAGTLDCSCNQGIFVKVNDKLTVYAVWYEKYQCYIAIRKLTPRECYRLQGWTDDYFEKSEFVNSNSQLYKTAGNGITVPVMEAIGIKLAQIEE